MIQYLLTGTVISSRFRMLRPLPLSPPSPETDRSSHPKLGRSRRGGEGSHPRRPLRSPPPPKGSGGSHPARPLRSPPPPKGSGVHIQIWDDHYGRRLRSWPDHRMEVLNLINI
ncbi:hypothetical protein OSB04_009074, partial [Centaurea solstitialis]